MTESKETPKLNVTKAQLEMVSEYKGSRVKPFYECPELSKKHSGLLKKIIQYVRGCLDQMSHNDLKQEDGVE